MISTIETTSQILSERRAKILRELASITGTVKTEKEYCSIANSILAKSSADIPFALLYLNDPKKEKAHLVLNICYSSGEQIPPDSVNLKSETHLSQDGCPIERVIRENQSEKILNLASRVGKITGGPWLDQVNGALVFSLASLGTFGVSGAFMVGISPRRALDESYEDFFHLLTNTLLAGIANVRTIQEERKRFAALAELDQAKTQFFSNVSHEFRTPLTLILGPVEESISDPEFPLPPAQRTRLELIRANTIRLRKLVDSPLELSRVEAGRIDAWIEPVDLAKFTSELASAFSSIMKECGLRYTITTPPVGEPVFVDREMWEKIVLNLISNAFKFTLEGEVAVRLLKKGNQVELSVRDSGAGIPTEELSKIFQRFHRVEQAQTQARSREGVGIGLALIQDLVKVHRGSIQAQSPGPNRGSTFTVQIPLGSGHLPAKWLKARPLRVSAFSQSQAFTSEARRWLPFSLSSTQSHPASTNPTSKKRLLPGRVLVVDDNAGMRD